MAWERGKVSWHRSSLQSSVRALLRLHYLTEHMHKVHDKLSYLFSSPQAVPSSRFVSCQPGSHRTIGQGPTEITSHTFIGYGQVHCNSLRSRFCIIRVISVKCIIYQKHRDSCWAMGMPEFCLIPQTNLLPRRAGSETRLRLASFPQTHPPSTVGWKWD